MTAAPSATGPFHPATQRWLQSGRQVRLGGRDVFVVERGPEGEGTGPATLLLHGFPTSSYDWEGVMTHLSQRRRVIACDFLGFGLSDKPEAFGYSLFDQADVVERLAAELGLSAVSVVSHDMGTSVHCELLARQAEGRLPFGLTASVLLNGSMLQWMAHITPFQQLLASNATLPQAIEMCRQSLGDMYLAGLQAIMQRGEAMTPEVGQVMLDLLRYQEGNLRLPAIAGYMRERYLHADRWLGALERAVGPLAFLWADGDPIAHAEMGREHARRAPQARYVELDGLGHFLMIEDPARVARELDALLPAA